MAWVDPVTGTDTGSASNKINEPDKPFKTLQRAIDAVYEELVDLAGGSFAPGSNPANPIPTTGTVIALPGVYGPQTAGTPNASGDVLPIVMRDRVHVRGQGAARCFLRGDGTDTVNVYWPDGQRTYKDKEVLLDMSRASPAAETTGSQFPPAWFDETDLSKDVVEVFDGFTFQGGDIQVFLRSGKSIAGDAPWVVRAVVSNCVFDMRSGWVAQGSAITGPDFGAMLMNRHSDQCGNFDDWGYLDTRLLLLNDTFILGQDSPSGWIHSAKNEAVGVINVNDPACNSNVTGYSDCDVTLRGVGNPGIVNCVFRTLPGTNQMALLGIDIDDTRVLDQGVPVQTNAFASARAGVQSPSFPVAGFASVPVDATVSEAYFVGVDCVYGDLVDCGGTSTAFQSAIECEDPPPSCGTSDCTALPLPTPQVEIYDGVAGVGADPAFVGEYLTRVFPSAFAADYVDWRLLPGAQNNPHPFQDRGYVPADNTITMANGSSFELPDHPSEPAPLVWDGEGYGSPRVVDGSPDLGHDEIHLLIMAGSYSDNSTSHHQPGFLAPDLPVGSVDRYVFVRRHTPGVDLAVGNLIKINGTDETPLNPQVGWSQPPGTLVPATVKQSLPVDYQTKWIRFANASVPTPWEHVVQLTSFTIGYKPLGLVNISQGHTFASFVVTDSEGSEHDYFNTQGVVYDDDTETSDLLRSNLKFEYR